MTFPVFDAHCDTISGLTDKGGSLYENNLHFDIKRALKYKGGYIQVLAAFIDRGEIKISPYERVVQLIEKFNHETEINKEFISRCITEEEINKCIAAKKVAAVLSVEGGEAIEGSLDKLDRLYDMGVRIMTLTWNYDNEISGSINGVKQNGLTEFGRKVVLKMNEKGMLADVSHISIKGFWDVIESTKKPIAATHSGVYALKNHQRNLSDEQIRAIIKNNGCIGINLYSEFLADGEAQLADLIKHIDYILALGGEDNVGIGSDFDGMDELPKEISGVQDIYKIADEMLKIGYTENVVKKVMGGNFMRMMSVLS